MAYCGREMERNGLARFDQMLEAYEVFGNAAKEKAMKVIISNE